MIPWIILSSLSIYFSLEKQEPFLDVKKRGSESSFKFHDKIIEQNFGR